MKSPEIQSLIDTAKEKAKALHNEEYVVVIKLQSQVNYLLLTYSKKVGGTLIQIDEINAAEELISTSKFKGKSCSGFCSQDIKELKPLLGSIKPKDWLINEEIYVDSYYKKH
jgi:hypothetical protein